jgi:hypothetical protein
MLGQVHLAAWVALPTGPAAGRTLALLPASTAVRPWRTECTGGRGVGIQVLCSHVASRGYGRETNGHDDREAG